MGVAWVRAKLLRCTACSRLHFDADAFAMRKHIWHVCTPGCNVKFKRVCAVQGNLLSILDPAIVGGKLYVARMPEAWVQDWLVCLLIPRFWAI